MLGMILRAFARQKQGTKGHVAGHSSRLQTLKGATLCPAFYCTTHHSQTPRVPGPVQSLPSSENKTDQAARERTVFGFANHANSGAGHDLRKFIVGKPRVAWCLLGPLGTTWRHVRKQVKDRTNKSKEQVLRQNISRPRSPPGFHGTPTGLTQAPLLGPLARTMDWPAGLPHGDFYKVLIESC